MIPTVEPLSIMFANNVQLARSSMSTEYASLSILNVPPSIQMMAAVLLATLDSKLTALADADKVSHPQEIPIVKPSSTESAINALKVPSSMPIMSAS